MSKTRTLRVAALGVFSGIALFLYLRPEPPRPPGIADPAPGFSLPGLSGGSVSLKDYKGRVVVLNFWATWCPPCVEETPSLERFSVKLAGLGVAVVGVSVDEDSKALAQFVADHHLTFPIARDPSRAVPTRFGTLKFPETYILDRGGRVAEKIIGAADWDDPRMERYAEALARPENTQGK